MHWLHGMEKQILITSVRILNIREGAYVSITMHFVCPSQVSATLFSCIMVLQNEYFNLKILEVWRGVKTQASLLFTL